MSYVSVRAFVFAIIGLSLHISCKAQSDVTVGNAPGEVLTVSGPIAPKVDLGACKFSIRLSLGQMAIFNDPDLVIYYASFSKGGEAYLSQAQTSFGSSWGFEKKGSHRDKWMGFMCESSENFSKIMSRGDGYQQLESTPALDDIRQSNDLRCPATLTAGKWVPRPNLKKSQDFLFREISGEGWSGFLIGYKASKKSKSITSLRFCAISGSHVLMGASENGDHPLALTNNFFYELGDSLSTIRFSDK